MNVSGNRLALAVACLALGYGVTAVAQDERAAKKVKIGVVDLGVLFKSYKRKDDLERAVNARREQLKRELELRRQEIKVMRHELNSSPLRKGSPARQLKVEGLKLANYRLELVQERMQSALKLEVERHTLKILAELEDTVASYGRQHQYTFIFKTDHAAPTGGDLLKQFQERIFRAQISDVLYHEAPADITPQVLQLLNSDANLRRMEKVQPRKRGSF